MLPTIRDYALPARDELPANRAAWRIDPNRALLLVHDMQTYFVDAYGPNSAVTRSVIERISRLRTAAREAAMPVYYTAQPPSQKPEDRGLLTDFWGVGLQDDGRASIVEELQPISPPDIITKWRYDAFVRTDLAERMANSGRDQIVVTGVYAHIGCLMTAASAFMHDIEPFLVSDAVADFSREDHSFALGYAAQRCAVVVDTAEAIAQITGASR